MHLGIVELIKFSKLIQQIYKMFVFIELKKIHVTCKYRYLKASKLKIEESEYKLYLKLW